MKTKNFLLSMIAVFAMVAFTSCSKVAEYFIVLDEASSDLVESAFKVAFAGEDYMSLGECEEEEAIESFETFCSDIDLYGLGVASVSLREDSPTGKKVKSSIIE